MLGINYDVTLLERMQGVLGGFLSCQGNLYDTMRENGAGTLEKVYDSCAEMMPDTEGKLSRERRQTLIRLLDSQQFFKLQKSIPYLSEKLNVSKYTLHKDLDDRYCSRYAQTVTDFADASHAESAKSRNHHVILRNFQFRKFLL